MSKSSVSFNWPRRLLRLVVTRRWVACVVAVTVVAAAAAFFVNTPLLGVPRVSQEPEVKKPTDVARPVKVMTVSSGGELHGRNLPGTVRASKRVELSFQINGTLIELPVEEGQEVEQGALLARLDPRDFEVAVRDAKSQMQRAESVVRLAAIEYERLERVKKAEPGAVAQSQIDRAVEHQAMAQADLLSAKAALDSTELQLSYTYLKAPFAGVVSRRAVDNFQEVRAKQPVMILDDLTRVEVLVDIPESMMGPVMRPGSHVAYAEFAPAPGERFPLTLKEYSVRADPTTLTYQVTAEMEQPKGEIKVLPGMTANVWAQPKDGTVPQIAVPAVAVFAQDGELPHVWVVNPADMTVHLREVKTGNLSGTDRIEIVEGLQNGESIAVTAVSQLRENMKIQRLKSRGN